MSSHVVVSFDMAFVSKEYVTVPVEAYGAFGDCSRSS